MKKYLVLALMLLLFRGLFAASPCYYKITVEGECSCEQFEWADCPDAYQGIGIFKQYSGDSILYPLLTEYGGTWSFSRNGTFFSALLTLCG